MRTRSRLSILTGWTVGLGLGILLWVLVLRLVAAAWGPFVNAATQLGKLVGGNF